MPAAKLQISSVSSFPPPAATNIQTFLLVSLYLSFPVLANTALSVSDMRWQNDGTSCPHCNRGAKFRPPMSDLTSKGIMESETTLELKVFVSKTSCSWNNSMQDFLFLLDFVPSYEEAYILFLNFSSQPDGKILTSLHICKV